MILNVSGEFFSGTNIKYICTLVRVEALCQFDMFSAEVGSATPENLMSIILGLGTYFSPVNVLSNKNRVMRRGMRMTCSLKGICYADRRIDLDEHLAVFPGSNESDKICLT